MQRATSLLGVFVSFFCFFFVLALGLVWFGPYFCGVFFQEIH